MDKTHSFTQDPIKTLCKVQELVKRTNIRDIVDSIREVVDNNRQVNSSGNRVVGYFVNHRRRTGVARCRGVESSIMGDWSLVNFKVLVKELWKLDLNCHWSLAHFHVSVVLSLR